MTIAPYRYHMPVEVRFGAGAFAAMPEAAAALGARPMLVTGRHAARAAGWIDAVCRALPQTVVFDAVDENPTTHLCEAGAARCRAAGCDVVIALGGGSAIDAAKAIALIAARGGLCADHFGAPAAAGAALPVVAVPTTAGSGSEATPYAVLVDPAGPVKRTLSGPGLFPRIALLDPELTLGLPRAITIATGLDALSQAMEGMVSRKATPTGDTLALEAIRLVRAWLPRAAEAPGDLAARGAMLHAAHLAGCVIAQSGTTLVHGMGYAYTLHAGIAHGLANALLLGPLFRVNAQHRPHTVAAIASALGTPCPPEPEPAAHAITRAVHALLEVLGVSPAARDAGVTEAQLDAFSAQVAAEPYRFKNQYGNFDEAAVRQRYAESHAGI